MLDNTTPLILKPSEAPPIGRASGHLRWAQDIVVVDSFSDDDTLEIVKTFPNVRVYQREFDFHGKQWEFGLRETGIRSEWVLALEPDYILTEEFLRELRMLNPAPEIKGFRVRFIYCVNGKRLMSGVYPPAIVLYRK